MNESKDNRFVAYFDMLGMKAATLRNQDYAWGALLAISEARKNIEKRGIKIVSSGKKIGDRVKAIIFSDSVIIFSLNDKAEDLWALLTYSAEFFKDCLSQCVPVRGGIAHGDFFFNFDEGLFLGIAFVKAYEIGECAQWYGIAVEKEVYDRSKELPTVFGAQSDLGIVEYNIPLKENKIEKGYVINWPGIFRPNFKKVPESPEELYKPLESLFGNYNDLRDDVKQKHINTYHFVKKQLDIKRKQK